MEKPKITNAPGLVLRPRKSGWAAVWQARGDLVKRGYKPTSIRVGYLTEQSTPEEYANIADCCNAMQADMLVWARGGIPVASTWDGTIGALARCYELDEDSDFQKLRYASKKNYGSFLRRIVADHGGEYVVNVRARSILQWHRAWSENGTAMAHGLVTMLRTILTFGATILDDPDCRAAREILRDMKFAMAKPRSAHITAEQVNAVRAKAHEMGMPSVALAQAIQFDLMLRQKDVIGEWVPVSEPGASEVVRGGSKWLRGIRWSEINGNLILRHTTSKRQKDIEVDLRLAPMVVDELSRVIDKFRRDDFPASGPMIVREDGYPWGANDFRKAWRKIADACGIPKSVRNMDSRAGAITEALSAGAVPDSVRKAATHSDLSMTQRYSRGDTEEMGKVMKLRAESRNKSGTK